MVLLGGIVMATLLLLIEKIIIRRYVSESYKVHCINMKKKFNFRKMLDKKLQPFETKIRKTMFRRNDYVYPYLE